MGLQLYAGIPLHWLEQRKHDIEDFRARIFPEIEAALTDLGFSGTVDFVSGKGSPAGFENVVIKAKLPDSKTQTTVLLKFPSASAVGDWVVTLKDEDGVGNVDSVRAARSDLVDTVESFFAEAAYRQKPHEAKNPDDFRPGDHEPPDPCDENAEACTKELTRMMRSYFPEEFPKRITITGKEHAEAPGDAVKASTVTLNVDGSPVVDFYFSWGGCDITWCGTDETDEEWLTDYDGVKGLLRDKMGDILDCVREALG